MQDPSWAPRLLSIIKDNLACFILRQGSMGYRAVPTQCAKRHVVCSQTSGANRLETGTHPLHASQKEWGWLVMQLPALHKNTSRKPKKSQSISLNSWRQSLQGKIHVTPSTWIRPLFNTRFIQIRHLKQGRKDYPCLCINHGHILFIEASPF